MVRLRFISVTNAIDGTRPKKNRRVELQTVPQEHLLVGCNRTPAQFG